MIDELSGDILDINKKIAPYEGNEKFIFISYAHKDSEIVMEIINNLQSNDYRVWYDEGIEPGTEWDVNIANHVENCGYFIAFMSKNYIASSNCKDELNFARDLEKRRFLVYIEDVELPSEMRMRLSRIQNIHMYRYEKIEDFYEKLFCADGLDDFKSEKENEGAVDDLAFGETETQENESKSMISISPYGKMILDNRYELKNTIGEGGFGHVYKADDMQIDNKGFPHIRYPFWVAVKIGHCKENYIVELHKFLAGVDNRYLCKIYDAKRNPSGETYIAMELLNGYKTLSSFKDYKEYYDKTGLNYSIIAGIDRIIDILKGLNCLHSKGIVHGDVHPDNIFITRFSTKLIDYSSSFFISDGPNEDGAHTAVLGFGYSPNEKLGFLSDLFSVGMVAIKWLTGILPDRDEHNEPVFDGIGLDVELTAILKKAIAVNPEDRFKSSEEFIIALKKYICTHDNSDEKRRFFPPIFLPIELKKQNDWENLDIIDEGFRVWLLAQEYQIKNVDEYISSVHAAEKYVMENQVPGVCLTSKESQEILSSIDALFKDNAFCKYMDSQPNIFRLSLDAFYIFIYESYV